MTTTTFIASSCGVVYGLAVTALAYGTPVSAEETDDEIELDAIVVTASEESGTAGVSHTGASQTQYNAKVLEREFSGAPLSTVLNSMAGVTSAFTAGDPAIAVNIRGLQDDGRVGVTIDGARQNFGRSGHTSNSTFYADTEMLRSVEIVRGPAGTDAAAGAIGGTLKLRTVEADDLIAPGNTQGGEARLRFGTLLDRPTVHSSWATRINENNDLLLSATTSKKADYTAPGGTEVMAHEENLSILGKYGHTFAGGQHLTFGISDLGSDYETGLGSIPRKNRMDTTSGTIVFEGFAGNWHTLDATLFHTDTRLSQWLLDDDGNIISNRRRYGTKTTGLRAEAGRDLYLGDVRHRLTLALDGYSDVVTVDDPDSTVDGLTAPGERYVWSLMAEDAIEIGLNTEVVPGLRFDTYRLDSDEGSSVGSQVSPSLVVRHTLGPVTLHATMAQAYRPPTLSEALVNGMHPEPADFLILPNPDLDPESATTFELAATAGFNDLIVDADRLDGRLAIYRSEVDDYIGLEEMGTLFDRYYQYQNIDHVRLEGIELELGYDAGRYFGRFTGQMTRGINTETDADISGVAPNRFSMTAGWRNPDQSLELGVRYTNVMSRNDGSLSSEAWDTWDLFLNKNIGERGKLNLQLNNITDETYTAYLTTEAAPGINAQVSLTWQF
ncbi:TonB-dependent receptor [Aquicoccus sp. SU-CL01552]|uniref:TonB-dependent receptor domain-containing protein n=1 Tax=Aquicoccus sp. SU-CL01552 TaxID=3127656 RepID=UPI0031053911